MDDKIREAFEKYTAIFPFATKDMVWRAACAYKQKEGDTLNAALDAKIQKEDRK
jgi:hypothetical protein